MVKEQTTAAPKEKKKKKQMTVKVPKWCGKWVVGMDDFKEGVVGANCKNCHVRIAVMAARASVASHAWQYGCAETHKSCVIDTSHQLSLPALMTSCMCIHILH